MLGGWAAIAAFAALVLLADGLARHRRRPVTVLLASAAAGLVLSTLGTVIVRLRAASDDLTLSGVAVVSGLGLTVGLLVGGAFAGLGQTTQTREPPSTAGADRPQDPECHPRT
ncbi:MAG: hypothetical protein HY830_28385 [Actinobacteria bacterium]|nr:hypothetical protein [Actinomycetota bacterium]